MKSTWTISRKFSVITFAILIVCMGVIGTLSYFVYRQDIAGAHSERALAIAQSMAAAVDAERIRTSAESGAKDDYWFQTKALYDRTALETGVSYIYLIDRYVGEELHYVLEGEQPDDEAPVDLGDLEVPEAFHEKMFETMQTGRPAIASIYYSEGYGDMVSGFAPVFGADGSVFAVVGVDVPVAEVNEDAGRFGLVILIASLLIAVLFGLAAMAYISRSIGAPISEIAEAAERVAQGDPSVTVRTDRGDEIGTLARAFSHIAESSREQVTALQAVAGGDLTAQIRVRGDRDATGHAIRDMAEELSRLVGDIRGSVSQIALGAGQVAAGSQELAQGSTQQAAAVEQLSASIDSVAGRTRDTAEQAARAAAMMTGVGQSAETGSERMRDLTGSVKDIVEASNSIAGVIDVIDGIAFQTNILALNAAVEAARAGAQGKGFAVVAEEVSTLAAKSAEAAKETSDLIRDSIVRAERGAKLAEEATDALHEIVDGVSGASGVIRSIDEAAAEQDRAIAEINKGIGQVSQVVQQNSATAEQSAAAAQELDAQGRLLEEMVGRFRVKALPDRA